MLAWVAAQTERIDIGSAVFQIPARTPAMTAMTAATLDSLSGGRFRLGLGVSGPQVSEGWHGVRFDKPLARTREYVDIVRMALARETVKHDGEFWTLPLPDGPGKALRLTVHPVRDDIPLYLAADRAEEPRADRRDRRRLAGASSSPPSTLPSSSATSPRAARPPARSWPASTSYPPCPW